MSDFEEGDDQEFTNSHTVTMTNGKFFTIRFEKDEDKDFVDVYQVFDEDNEIYLMSMAKEHLVEMIYQFETMLNG
jgi:hypothetical protein